MADNLTYVSIPLDGQLNTELRLSPAKDYPP